MTDIYAGDVPVFTTGTLEEKLAALQAAEVVFQQAKEAYRVDMSDQNRAAFHAARNKLQIWRNATRGSTPVITADEVN